MDIEMANAEPLLGDGGGRTWLGHIILPVVMCSSAAGMLTLKFSQQNDSPVALTVGYLLEGFAFAVYPYALRYHTLRFVTSSWAASSILISYVGGYLVYDEIPSFPSTIGGLLIILGVGMTVF